MYLAGDRRIMDGMEESRETWRLGHRPALDGVRGIAIGLVLFGHAFAFAWTPSAGSAGVTVFFVLSGFLITALLLEELDRSGRISLGRFYERRARRLLPALGVTVVGFLALVPAFMPGFPGGFPWRSVAGALTYSTNWLAIGHKEMGLSYLWSLAIEEQFYIVWPLLLVVLVRLVSRRVLAGVLAGLAVAVLMWRDHLWATASAPADHLYFGTDTRCDGLLLGCALALFLHGRTMRKAGGTWAVAGMAWIALCTALPIGYGFFVAMPFFVAVGTAAMIYGAAQDRARWLSWRPLTWLGERSYGIYLYHAVFGMAPLWIVGANGALLRLLVMVPVTLVVADLSYRYVETPLRRRTSERRGDTPGAEQLRRVSRSSA